MFANSPYIVGGSSFGCIGSDGAASPFYTRVNGESLLDLLKNTLTIPVRVAKLVEMVYGNVVAKTDVLTTDPAKSRRFNLPLGNRPTPHTHSSRMSPVV